jgi:Fe2+ or Zn2+ uptake regulation protein
MVKAGEKPIEQTVVKRTASSIDMYYLYFSQLSVLGLRLTKIQIKILANIALHFPSISLKAKEKKELKEYVNTSPQVIENTFVQLRKRGILQKDNILSPRFTVNLIDGYKLTILFKDDTA